MPKQKTQDITFWSRNCTGCSRARRFFASHPDVEYNAVDVRATPIFEDEAMDIVRAAKRLLTKEGTSVQEFDLVRDRPEDEELRRIVLGRSRTMRAPALQVGETIMIGYDEDTYLELLGLE